MREENENRARQENERGWKEYNSGWGGQGGVGRRRELGKQRASNVGESATWEMRQGFEGDSKWHKHGREFSMIVDGVV